MKVVAISDVHRQISALELPTADLLIIAGDLTGSGSVQQMVEFNKDLFAIKDKYRLGILAINGNHDFLGEKDFARQKVLCSNVKYFLQHESIIIEGIKFFGSPYTCRFFDWAFQIDRGEDAKRKWSQIDEDTQVLITHGQPYGILDETRRGEHVGDKDLLDAIDARPSIRVVIGGHIHHSHGTMKIGERLFINASSCDEDYKPTNKPIEFEI